LDGIATGNRHGSRRGSATPEGDADLPGTTNDRRLVTQPRCAILWASLESVRIVRITIVPHCTQVWVISSRSSDRKPFSNSAGVMAVIASRCPQCEQGRFFSILTSGRGATLSGGSPFVLGPSCLARRSPSRLGKDYGSGLAPPLRPAIGSALPSTRRHGIAWSARGCRCGSPFFLARARCTRFLSMPACFSSSPTFSYPLQ